ncbi:MAG: hypothetical protein Q7R57_01265, partial [Dehalococcoidales bacterium]|nr:hypothetical protein [Dehalococcoidales bacterium]
MFQKSLSTKLCSGLLVLAVLLPLALSCKQTPEPRPEPVPANPFTSNYQVDESNAKFFTNSDSVALLAAASPFYIADQPLPSQQTGAYEKARAKKIDEIKKEAQSLALTVTKLKPKLGEVKGAYISYLQTSLDAEPQLLDFVSAVVTKMQDVDDSEAILESEYNSIDTSGLDSAYARSFLDYMKVVKAAELGSLYLQDIEDLAAYAGLTLTGLSKHNSAVISKAGEKLIQNMKGLDGLKPDVLAIISSRQKIDYGLRQLSTGSYYFALAANDFISKSLHDLEAAADKLTPREGLTKADIQAIQQYLALFERQLEQVKQQTQAVDKSKLITVSVYEDRPGVAYAAEPPGNFAKAVSSVQGPARADEDANKKSTYFSKDWADTWKGAVSIVSNDYQVQLYRAMLKEAQQGVGQIIDVTKVAVDYGVTAGVRRAYGIPKDVIDENVEMSKAWVRYQQNLENNMSGVEVLRNAGSTVKGAEDAVGKGASLGVKAIGGNEWMASGVGEVSRLTVGLFTGMVGNVYTLADQSSTPADLAVASLGLAFSLYGGSKTLMTAPLVKSAEEKMGVKLTSELVKSLLAREEKQVATMETLKAILRGAASDEFAEYAAQM